MPDVVYHSFEMNGKKSSFADWVSNISPTYTPFISMIKKVPIKNTIFNWQQDVLTDVNTNNAFAEGSSADDIPLVPTQEIFNYTQIFRKVVEVSDSANSVDSYGRNRELQYQVEKASKGMKRDIETTFLALDQTRVAGNESTASQTAGLAYFVEDSSRHFDLKTDTFEDDLFKITEELYTKGAESYVIMFHPGLGSYFSGLMEKRGERLRIFENDTRFVKQVERIIDPLGQEFHCIPNRFMDAGCYYIFDPRLVEVAVLREVKSTELGKTGSSTKYMIEQEIGLRVNNGGSVAIALLLTGPEPTAQPAATTVTENTPATFNTTWPANVTQFQWWICDDAEGTDTKVFNEGSSTEGDLIFTAKMEHNGKFFFCEGTTEDGERNFSDKVQITVNAAIVAAVEEEVAPVAKKRTSKAKKK